GYLALRSQRLRAPLIAPRPQLRSDAQARCVCYGRLAPCFCSVFVFKCGIPNNVRFGCQDFAADRNHPEPSQLDVTNTALTAAFGRFLKPNSYLAYCGNRVIESMSPAPT